MTHNHREARHDRHNGHNEDGGLREDVDRLRESAHNLYRSRIREASRRLDEMAGRAPREGEPISPAEANATRERPMTPHAQPFKLYRSRKDVVFLGVCGGVAEHVDMAPWGVRVIVMLLALFTGIVPALVIYLVLGLTLKPEPEVEFGSREDEEFWNVSRRSPSAAIARIERRFKTLRSRLERLESIVTSTGFQVDSDMRDL